MLFAERQQAELAQKLARMEKEQQETRKLRKASRMQRVSIDFLNLSSDHALAESCHHQWFRFTLRNQCRSSKKNTHTTWSKRRIKSGLNRGWQSIVLLILCLSLEKQKERWKELQVGLAKAKQTFVEERARFELSKRDLSREKNVFERDTVLD